MTGVVAAFSNDIESWFRYWGKAMPDEEGGERFHLLAFHSLDVAACAQRLLALPHFSLCALARDLGWSLDQTHSVFVYFMALHDQGKFARAFQGLAPALSPLLVEPDVDTRYGQRHDTLGWWLWRTLAKARSLPELLPEAGHDFWGMWMRVSAGHHGLPPAEKDGGGVQPAGVIGYFNADDVETARQFMHEVGELLLKGLRLPSPTRQQLKILRKHSWRLAGLAVLADWLGSNQAFFPYRSTPLALSQYWAMALERADKSLSMAGLRWSKPRHWQHAVQIFDYLTEPTPLQHYAASVELEKGPQLFLLEDVTGAGKTEAALILTQRLMQQGYAHGLYFALPSMATANQMYERVGPVYSKLYEEGARPSLVLSHGARQLVDGFRRSVLQAGDQHGDMPYQPGEGSASIQCNAWLADNRKKALLAEVGVGTIDQALLAILPVRHQSLRMIGLSGKVMIVDEVHAYDPYMMNLLEVLLISHARLGGSAILLSATLPSETRERLLNVYRLGLGATDELRFPDQRYPLATQIGTAEHVPARHVHACQTRPQLKRKVSVELVHDELTVLSLIETAVAQGKCVAWIRNTVNDARQSWKTLAGRISPDRLLLFHSRYVMADRLDIEGEVLSRFGKKSSSGQRAGWVLVGTQVLEQSLDFDVDVMITDLAPIDLIIQRAGRLQRHARQINGDLSDDGVEHRQNPVLYVLSPAPEFEVTEDWYKAMFPTAAKVYPDAGRLWLCAQALQQIGTIISPGEVGEAGSVRSLVEAVYGADSDEMPSALQQSHLDQWGESKAKESQANFNALKLDKGYSEESSARWYEDERVPTRLGDESLTVYLAVWDGATLQALKSSEEHPWEASSVRIPSGHAHALSFEWSRRFGDVIEKLRARWPVLKEPAFVLPLANANNRLMAEVVDAAGRTRTLWYSQSEGLCW